MKKVQERTSRIHWQPLIVLVAAIVVSVVVLSGEELKHVPPASPSFVVLHSFTGADGGIPTAGLVRDAAGNLYGTTAVGGAECPFPVNGTCGVVFKLSPSGTETVLHTFTGEEDGGIPRAGLIRDSTGNLYGTTQWGGSGHPCAGEGNTCGVVFQLNPNGTETVLYSFSGADGGQPYAGLIQDAEGNLYGTTQGGGASNAGVVFKLSPSGTETVLYSFTGGADGALPEAGLVRDAAGNLYGTTPSGGEHVDGCPGRGCGVVFKVSSGGTETVLHSFTGGADGVLPEAGLVRDGEGNLYGTTYGGGAFSRGVVFELIRCDTAASGYEFKVLYSFTGGIDGAYPAAGLLRDAAGNLYGTTSGGASGGRGVVFKLGPTGAEMVLHSFTGGPGGANPVAGLIQDPAGNLYGTTSSGGIKSDACNGFCGVVFRLTP
jgi:uncharacterized repeat protein (TIGR03803 family)